MMDSNEWLEPVLEVLKTGDPAQSVWNFEYSDNLIWECPGRF